MRETSILGILGIATLGFYVDSAIQEIRLDRAALLILITALVVSSTAAYVRAGWLQLVGSTGSNTASTGK